MQLSQRVITHAAALPLEIEPTYKYLVSFWAVAAVASAGFFLACRFDASSWNQT